MTSLPPAQQSVHLRTCARYVTTGSYSVAVSIAVASLTTLVLVPQDHDIYCVLSADGQDKLFDGIS